MRINIGILESPLLATIDLRLAVMGVAAWGIFQYWE
jgi:hypothetical protein